MKRARAAAKTASLQIHIDGAARGNPGPAGAGIVLKAAGSRSPEEKAVYLGIATNNVAESCALILALQCALQMKAGRVEVFTDSELLARQVNGEYRIKDTQLQWLHALIRNLIEGFDGFQIQHVRREKNRAADRLANQAVNEGLKQNPGHRHSSAPAAELPDSPVQPTLF